jgi:hypothetical protein
VAGLGAALFLLIAALAYPRGMGMGDVKLALLLGVAVGWAVPVALMGGMILALIPSVVLFAKYGGTEVKLDGEDYLVIRESDLLAIVTDGKSGKK